MEKVAQWELHNLYTSSDIIRQSKSRRMRWAGHVAHMGEKRQVYKNLIRKSEGKTPLGRLNHRWEDRIRTDLRKIGWGGVEWNHLAQDRGRWQAVVNVVMNLHVLVPQIQLASFTS
jgi:hypothetical protein